MPLITYVAADGTTTVLDADPGDSVMRTAVLNGVTGIVGECGGGASCGTCHVYVRPGEQTELPDMHPLEDDILRCTAAPRRDDSRLSCQLRAERLEGLVVHMPDRQI